MTADDPRTSLTYGEFPTSSMDELIDLALEKHLSEDKKEMTLVDLGSGCGRLVLYTALTRGLDQHTSWNVHGIEISSILHDEGLRAALAGIDNNSFLQVESKEGGESLRDDEDGLVRFVGG